MLKVTLPNFNTIMDLKEHPIIPNEEYDCMAVKPIYDNTIDEIMKVFCGVLTKGLPNNKIINTEQISKKKFKYMLSKDFCDLYQFELSMFCNKYIDDLKCLIVTLNDSNLDKIEFVYNDGSSYSFAVNESIFFTDIRSVFFQDEIFDPEAQENMF